MKRGRSVNKTLLEDIFVDPTETPPLVGVVVGHLVELSPNGAPMVDYEGNAFAKPLLAKTTTPLQAADIGREIALVFEEGDGARPLVIGPLLRPGMAAATDTDAPAKKTVSEVKVDGKRMAFTAEEEIVLSCGESSITLTQAGKILIRGKYILSRSSGVNRIKGGSIQLN